MINDELTPNGLYFLMAMIDGKGLATSVNYNNEKKLLTTTGFITDNKITQKGYLAIEKYKKVYKTDVRSRAKQKRSFSDKEAEMIYQYREIFPTGMLPSGYPARLAFKELEKRFLHFFDNYDYTWETILKATKMYVNKYKDDNYMYMKTSGYFILKNEKGVETSTLANYCDMVLEAPKVVETPIDGAYSSAI
jgi:hypothetical protein